MTNDRPTKLIDPVCGMTVGVESAERDGLLLEYDARTYAFCSSGCRRSFVDDAARYVAAAEAAPTFAQSTGGVLPIIDAGMRRWYESCSCCLSEAFPEVKAQLDAERAAAAQPPVDLGMCEVAEAAVAHSH
jgi:YHS domain-containing protein